MLVAALSGSAWTVSSCYGDYERRDAASTGGTAGTDATTGGGEGGKPAGGEDGADAGTSGSGATCSRDADCVPLSDCYSASCRVGTCMGSPLPRGSECSDGFCNGFARCLPCLDDNPRRQRDTGCSRREPVCVETASEPACVGCEEDADCNDDVECTADRCSDSACENVPASAGTSCSGGVCTGQADEDSCAPCIDDAMNGVDTGCAPDRPRCDTEATPAECAGCESSLDCDDDEECTSDGCRDGVCERATLLSGTPCSLGYCNGIPGVETCIFKPCLGDADCNDRVACTAEVCVAGACAYTANHGQCPATGDICRRNLCGVGAGCREVDVSRTPELLSNGSLDLGNVAWTEMSASYAQVIYPYDYVPTLLPHTEVYVAWLGGGEGSFDDENSLSQVVTLPAGTVRLELSFFYQIWSEENLPDFHNHLRVALRSAQANPNDGEIVTFYNQDQTRVWSRFSTTLDATDWADSDVILEFSGTGIDGYTHFFVDTIALVATVCE